MSSSMSVMVSHKVLLCSAAILTIMHAHAGIKLEVVVVILF
jgi:hypothetical protein